MMLHKLVLKNSGEFWKTAFSEQQRRLEVGQRRIFVRKIHGGMTILAKLQSWKDVFERGQLEKMNIWSPREHLGMLFMLQKRQQKKRTIKEHDTRIFKTDEQMKMGNQDVAGKKCVLDDNNNFCFDIKSKRIVWKEYYNQLLNFF